MADNVTIGSSPETADVASGERTIAAATVQLQRVIAIGSKTINAAQVNISTSAATIIALNDTRMRVTLLNRLGVPLFIGEATVTAANGFQLDNGAALTICTTALIQGITAVATSGTYVHVLEEYD